MIEIFDIIILFFIFSLFLLSPLNFTKKKVFGLECNKNLLITFNLILNLNILLIFSIIPLEISKYYLYIISFLILFLLKNFSDTFETFKIRDNILSTILFFTLFFILSLDIANDLNLGWDAKWFYLIESLYYSQGNTFRELSDQMFKDFHPHPHLGSYLWAFFSNLSINNHEYYGRLFYLFVYIFSLVLITNKLFNNQNFRLIILTILTIITYKYKYFSGLQEILIFSNLVFISVILYEYISNRKITDLFLITLCLNLILWIKAEGIVYFFLIIFCINLIKKFNYIHRIRFNLICLLILLTKIYIYHLFEIKPNNQPYSTDFIEKFNFEILFHQIYNIFIYFIYNSINNIIYIVTLLIFIFEFKKIFKDEYYKSILTFFVLNICFIFSAYIIRDQEVIYSLKTTIDRVIFASSGFYLFFILLYIKKIYSSFNK